jgi:hypothetical protein
MFFSDKFVKARDLKANRGTFECLVPGKLVTPQVKINVK